MDPVQLYDMVCAVDAFFEYLSNELGIPAAKLRCIYDIYLHEGCTQQMIADRAGISRMTASERIIKIEKEGFIKRNVYDKNKSGKQVFLTESGRKLAAEIDEKFIGFTSHLIISG